MRTSKPFSTISYNTPEFLLNTCNRLLNDGHLDFFSFINHTKEDDEEKDHFHVYFVPSKLTDTNQFFREFIEFVPSEKLPRKCRPAASSKFQDWFLYCLHHSGYLASKGQSRKYHYTIEDIICSDNVFLLDQVHQIDWTKINPLGDVINSAKSGISFAEFLQTTNLNLLQIRAAQFVFEQVQGGNLNITNRNRRHSHSEKPDISPWRDKSL